MLQVATGGREGNQESVGSLQGSAAQQKGVAWKVKYDG
jgi:hypothetical protein